MISTRIEVPSDIPRVDLGLGTAYERWAIYVLLAKWFAAAPPQTALEGPIDGMAGIPGLHLLPLARRGTLVTVIVPDRVAADNVKRIYERAGLPIETLVGETVPPERRFDLVMTFNALPLVDHWRAYLDRLAAAARQTLIVSVTNCASYGTYVRRTLRLAQSEPRPELFDHEVSFPKVLRPQLETYGTILDSRYVDCPWWPDLFVDAGQTLVGALTGGRLGSESRADATAPHTFTAETFPFIDDHYPRDLARALARHPGFDDRGRALGRFFGHHLAYRVSISA